VLEARGRYGAERLEPYRRRLDERFGKQGHLRPTRRLPVGLVSALANAFMSSRWFARRVLLERWFLRMELPPLGTASALSATPRAA
jgi:hypothetical protein